MRPKHVIGELVIAEADEDGGLFEGRSEKGHGMRRFGGYPLLEVSPEDSERLKSPHVGDEEKSAILKKYSEPVNPEAHPTQDTYGLQRVIGGVCMNILQRLPEDIKNIKINSLKAVETFKEYPRPKASSPDQS